MPFLHLHRMKKHGVFHVEPHPEQRADNIIPRGPHLDPLIRKFHRESGIVDLETRPKVPSALMNLGLELSCPEDDIVLEWMRTNNNQLSTQVKNSFIEIRVRIVNGAGAYLRTNYASGCIISHHHAITCAHAFDVGDTEQDMDNTIESITCIICTGRTFTAKRMDFDEMINSATNPECLLVYPVGGGWDTDKGLDFAVLNTTRAFPFGLDEILKIPDSPHWYPSAPLCGIGRPVSTVGQENPCEFFPNVFNGRLSSMDTTKRNRALGEFINSACFGFRSPVALFGSATSNSLIKKAYYASSTMSCNFGCSGGPVIILDRPNELAGLMLGAFGGFCNSVFLDVQTPVIKLIYKHCLENDTPSRSWYI